MSDATIQNGDVVAVYGRPATVERTLDGEHTKVRFDDTGGVAWPEDQRIQGGGGE